MIVALRAIELGAEENARRIFSPRDRIAIGAPPVGGRILKRAAAGGDQVAGKLIKRFVFRNALANPAVEDAHAIVIELPLFDL